MTERTKFSRVVCFVTTFALVLLPALPVYAQCGECTGGFCNPIKFCTIQEFIVAALRALVVVAIPFLALFIVYAGFKFITAQGNSSELSKAKMNFLYVILGTLLILGAWIIATLIGGTISQIATGP